MITQNNYTALPSSPTTSLHKNNLHYTWRSRRLRNWRNIEPVQCKPQHFSSTIQAINSKASNLCSNNDPEDSATKEASNPVNLNPKKHRTRALHTPQAQQQCSKQIRNSHMRSMWDPFLMRIDWRNHKRTISYLHLLHPDLWNCRYLLHTHKHNHTRWNCSHACCRNKWHAIKRNHDRILPCPSQRTADGRTIRRAAIFRNTSTWTEAD